MNDSLSDALLRRVAALERDARHFRTITTLLVLLLVAVSAIGAAAVSRTSTPFALTQNGVTRVRLDAAGMHLYDAAGKQRIFIGFNTHNQPALHLIDKSGTTRESIYLQPSNGNPAIDQIDTAGNIRETFYLDAKNSPEIDQQDKRGHAIASYYINDNDGFGRIVLTGSDGKDRFYVTGDNKPFLSFGDGSYNQRLIAGLTTEGDGLLRMKDTSGNETISIEGQVSGPFMRMYEHNQERTYLGVFTDGTSGLLFKNAYGTQTGSYP